MKAITTGTVARILKEEDIEGLLAAGAPTDEYEAEAKLIAEAVARLSAPRPILDEVAAIVTDVCVRMFGPFDDEQLRGRQPVYHRVAQRILATLQEP